MKWKQYLLISWLVFSILFINPLNTYAYFTGNTGGVPSDSTITQLHCDGTTGRLSYDYYLYPNKTFTSQYITLKSTETGTSSVKMTITQHIPYQGNGTTYNDTITPNASGTITFDFGQQIQFNKATSTDNQENYTAKISIELLNTTETLNLKKANPNVNVGFSNGMATHTCSGGSSVPNPQESVPYIEFDGFFNNNNSGITKVNYPNNISIASSSVVFRGEYTNGATYDKINIELQNTTIGYSYNITNQSIPLTNGTGLIYNFTLNNLINGEHKYRLRLFDTTTNEYSPQTNWYYFEFGQIGNNTGNGFLGNATTTYFTDPIDYYNQNIPDFFTTASGTPREPTIIYTSITGLVEKILNPVGDSLSTFENNWSTTTAYDNASSTGNAINNLRGYAEIINTKVFNSLPIVNLILTFILLSIAVMVFKGIWYLIKLIR